MDVAISRKTISSAAALAAVEAAVACGRSRDKSVVAAVADASGDLMACLRADGAFSASVGIAKDRAYTAAVFGASTDDLSRALIGNPVLHHGIAGRASPCLVAVCRSSTTELSSAFGISGGSEDDDRDCAKAGAATLTRK